MSTKTSYSIVEVNADGTTTEVDGSPVSRLDKAKDLANARWSELDGLKTVQVMTSAGNVSFTVDAATEQTEDLDAEAEELVAASKRSAPWTRVDSAEFADKIEAEFPDAVTGYELAYTRKRTEQGVYRALDKSGWRVVDGNDGSFKDFANTTEAREFTNEKTAAYNEQVKAEREQARLDRAATREAKRVAREVAKEEAAKAKEQAKLEKEAAKEAAAAEDAATEEAKELDGANA